jgi:glycosyltransferase involved in cell wall biosynthesis
LHQQLAWLAAELDEHPGAARVLVLDDASTDGTQALVESWRGRIDPALLTYQRHASNIGLIPNISACITGAWTEFVWTLGDDDAVRKSTLGVVLELLDSNPQAALFYLNTYGRDVADPPGTVAVESYFDRDYNGDPSDGKAVIAHHLEYNHGSVIFLSSAIWRTQLAQEAIETWRGSPDNWFALGYWSGYCGAQGPVIVTRERHVEMLLNNSQWQEDPWAWPRIVYRDMPQVFTALRRIGYSREFCRRMVFKELRDSGIRWWRVRSHLRVLRRTPGAAPALLRAFAM